MAYEKMSRLGKRDGGRRGTEEMFWAAAVLATLLGFNGDELKRKRICFPYFAQIV